MSTKHMTMLLWYGDSAGVKVNRRYDIDEGDKFKDFFGARRTIEEGVWRQTNGKVLVGSKAYKRMSHDAKALLHDSTSCILGKQTGIQRVHEKYQRILGTFGVPYGKLGVTAGTNKVCSLCDRGLCTSRCLNVK